MRLRKPSKKTILAGMMLASLVLMLLPARCSRWVSDAVGPVLAPLGDAGMRVAFHVRQRAGELAGQGGSEQEDERTALMLTMLQERKRQQETIAQLQNWRRQLDDFPCKLIQAGVVGVEGVPLRNRRRLDSGSRDGARPGDLVTTRRLLHPMRVALLKNLGVLGRNFVVGRIIESGGHTATLQLVIDPAFEMPGRLYRRIEPGKNRSIYVDLPGGGRRSEEIRYDPKLPDPQFVDRPVPVLAQGDGRRMVLRQVPAEHGIRAGDILTTGPETEALLPFGLTVGKVTRTQPEPEDVHSVTVFVEPLADLAGLRQVYIVLPIARPGQ